MKSSSPVAACLLVAGALLLPSCGGGGGGGGPAPSPAPADQAIVVADTGVPVGKHAGAVVAGLAGPLSDVTWTQTSGAPVELLSAKSQAISFAPTAVGPHQFTVSFRDSTGTARTLSATINVTAAGTGSSVTARVDHAVRAGSNVSLRAWTTIAPGDSATSLTWTQLAGPQVALDTTDPRRVLFVAPNVASDTVLRFRVTLQTTLGTDSDDVYVLVERYPQAPAGAQYVFEGLHVSRVHPYRSAAQGNPYANVLAGCTYNAQLHVGNLCPLSTLPFLHQETGGALPTIDQVMNRVLVSHDWMGDVFREFLETNDTSGDIRRLLNGVTAVVIGSHVRPSFYYAATGAIYLDADNFWLTPEQRDVVNEAPDFRSDFDRDLGYSSVWRYALNGNSLFLPFPPTDRIPRTVEYLLYEAGWLMFHELAHASDFMPPAARGNLVGTLSAWHNIVLANSLVSDQLTAAMPLQSAELSGLAQVKFHGQVANTTQRGYTPLQVAGFFSADRANDEYNYSTTREDTAMLFEEFMVARNIPGARRDFAITDKIQPTTTSQTLIVRWGQRGRAGDAAVKPRVDFVVRRLAPWVTDADPDAVTNLPAPLAMRDGESWFANLTLPAPPGGARVTAARARALSDAEDAYLLRRAVRRHHHHAGAALPGAIGGRTVAP